MLNKSFYWFRNLDAYAKLPKALLTNPKYEKLGADEIVLYTLMVDRMDLSVDNVHFYDPYYGPYVYFTIDEVKRLFGCCNSKAVKMINNFVKADLLFKKKQGQGRPSKLIPMQYEEYRPKNSEK